MKSNFPRIMTEFESEEPEKNLFYVKMIERILNHGLPSHFFEEGNAAFRFQKQLPIVTWTPFSEPPFILTFYLCCKFRANAFRFFYEMVSRWLIPGKRLNALLQFALDFFIPDFGHQKYTGGKVIVRVETLKEFEILKKNLPIIESEIRLGVESSYQASRILEIKGLTSDEKTATIQENIVSLIRHRPQDFDYDILSEMQHFLVLCKEEFKASRSFRHMSRIICVHYLFRKALRTSLDVFPDRRYISVKLIRALLNQKPVLGIAIGISFIRDNESFETKHIMNGIKAIVPDAKLVSGSYFVNQRRSDPNLTIYLEIEKESGRKILLGEERALKQELPAELKSRVEVRLNPIFMPQNEEEIMRHILTLSNELKLVRDLPQVIIDFNQQTEDSLEFIVILLRIIPPDQESFSPQFRVKEKNVEYIHDRTKIVGTIRKKYKKEASVYRFRIAKDPFLRKDHSLDLYKARQKIVKELSNLIGEFRDYNGGIIAKETELFETLRKSLDREKSFLLENFFYSLNPPLMRSLLPQDALHKLFIMVLEGESEGLPEGELYSVCIQEDSQYFYFFLIAREESFQDVLSPLTENFGTNVTNFFLTNTEYPCFGAIVPKEKGQSFKFAVEKALNDWAENQFILQN